MIEIDPQSKELSGRLHFSSQEISSRLKTSARDYYEDILGRLRFKRSAPAVQYAKHLLNSYFLTVTPKLEYQSTNRDSKITIS